ncbi:MAG: class I SAM-dependent methyltransferase [Acidobacteria bacterium]|nr:class I SAM-dependent methyltransferase [Acidobacteriota bacterium]
MEIPEKVSNLLPEKLRSILRGSPSAGEARFPSQSSPTLRGNGPRLSERESVAARQSRGLEQFFGHIHGKAGLRILDLAGLNQENVNLITNLGHKLFSVDFTRSLAESFTEPDLSDQSSPGRIESFLAQTLNYPEESMDGALVWDALEYMSPALLSATIDRLFHVLRPQSCLLAFFHSDDKVREVPYYGFRLHDLGTLLVSQRGVRRPVQTFNNRSLERLFAKFESVKFFLTRENLRELIVKR